METSLKKNWNRFKIISLTLLSLGLLILNNCNILSGPPQQITIYFSDENLMFLVPVTYEIKEKTSTPKKALELLISSEPPGKSLYNLFPEETTLLNLEVKDGIACLDFSRNFRKAFEAGGTEGNLLISSINYTLSHFEEIKGMKFLMEGKEIETPGELDLKEPIAIDRWKNLFLTGKESRIPGEENRATIYFLEHKSLFIVPVTCVFQDSKTLPQNVIHRLVKGLDEEWARPTLPAGTEVLSFRVEDNVAYIDFNSAFLKVKTDIPPELVINSLAFSLTEFNYIKKIHITVEGKDLKKYGSINLPSAISRPEAINMIKLNDTRETGVNFRFAHRPVICL
ncbi:MAG: GerMN domain-containing protein [Candidatus Eremiobacterota bacterium]